MSSVQSGNGEAVREIADLALNTVNRARPISPSTDDVQTFVVDQDETVVVQAFEKYLEAPRRPRGNTTVTDTASFVALVAKLTNEFTSPGDVAIYASIGNTTVTAVLNHLTWCDHTVTLKLEYSPEFKHWVKANSSMLNQMHFADHLQDGRGVVVEPSAADLMQIARTFKAKRNVSYESGVHLQSGDVQFTYHEETKAGSGAKGNIEIPERFTLNLPVFLGGAVFPLEAELRYNADQGGLQLGYRLDNPDLVVRSAFGTVLEQVGGLLGDGYLLLQGTAPTAPREL